MPAPNKIPLSLYVHIPWCVKKCPYCDFNSHEKNQAFDEDRYVQALLLDLEQEKQRCQQTELSSIFFGGGTPSLFSAESILRVIDQAKALFRCDDLEITLEANPGTFEQARFEDYRQAGVNRLSIGIQSFNPQHLATLGRIHDDSQALSAVDTAHHAGFDNINLDLMFGLPQQSVAQAVDDIEKAIAASVTHISHYQLTIEANTWFHTHTPVLPGSDLAWSMQTECQRAIADNAFQQYEISAYAKNDSSTSRRCRHNLNYWHFADYIGIGAGAHGKLTMISEDNASESRIDIQRHWKHRQPQQYIEQTLLGNSISGEQQLAEKDIIFEFLLNALRLKTGTDRQIFERHTGLRFKLLQDAVSNIDPMLLHVDDAKVATTEKGYLFLNDILEALV